MEDLKQLEAQLESAILENDTEKALQILLELTTHYARGKEFIKAEQYRDRLYDVDPLALSTIIEANEVIEDEKSDGINPTHRELFSGFYDSLTTEQENALFYSLEEVSVPLGQHLCRQGDASRGLFFVNTGKLRVECLHGDRNVFIKFLSPGTIFGSETFFGSSLCTTSVVAVSNTELHKLDKDAFGPLKKKFPGLEGTLKRYCADSGTISDHVLQNSMERRRKTRQVIYGKTAIHFSSDAGTVIGKPLRVELLDISSSGTAFLLRMTNEEKADSLLGQKIVVEYSSETVTPPFSISKPGTIVAISPNLFDDYSFHIRFDQELEPSHLETILTVFGKGD